MPTDSFMEVKDAAQATKRIDGDNSDDATPEFRQAYVQRVGGTLTNRSGTITTGGTAQTLAAANANRRYLFIQNLSAGDLWINFTTTAIIGQPSIRLDPGASFTMEGSFVSTELMSVIGATTGQAWAAKEGG